MAAVYERNFGFGDVTLANATLAGHTATGLDDHVLIRTAPGADAGPTLAGLAKRYPASAVTGTAVLALGATMPPIGRVLRRTRPAEGIGNRG